MNKVLLILLCLAVPAIAQVESVKADSTTGALITPSAATFRLANGGPVVITDSELLTSTVPANVGQLLFDVVTDKIYVAFGTSAGEWRSIFEMQELQIGTGGVMFTEAAGAALTRTSLEVAQAIFDVKTADTSRSSTSTLADDPDLTQSLEAGTYHVTVSLVFTSASGTPGVKYKMASTGGTYSVATGHIFNGSHNSIATGRMYPNTVDADIFAPTMTNTANTTMGRVEFSLVVTATTTLSVQWAQNSPDATATLLKAGSFMKIERLP